MAPIVKVRTLVLGLAMLALVSSLAVPVAVQTSPDLFDGRSLPRLDLQLNANDWRELSTNPAARTYYPATLKWESVTARNVGVQSDGGGGLAFRKPRLLIDTSRYVGGLTFQGLQTFTLDGLGDDPSGIRRVVTARFYQRLGFPRIRAAHVALYVNNTPSGVYVIRESIDAAMTSAAARQEPGRLYRYIPLTPHRLETFNARELLRPWSDRAGFPASDYTTIDESVRAISDTGRAVDDAQLARYVDARMFVRLAAVQTFLGEPDGLAGRDGASNFSVNLRGRSDALQFVPNGESLGLFDPQYPIDEGRIGSVLARRTFQSPALSRAYADALLAVASEADTRDAPWEALTWLEAEVRREQQLIGVALTRDSLKPWSDGDVRRAVDRVLVFAQQRASFVRCELARLRTRGLPCGNAPALGSVPASAAPSARTLLVQGAAAPPGALPTNIARGRPYTLAPQPNYTLTTDPGDDAQLTDGEYTPNRPIWTRATTVGWTNTAPATVVIDLGSIQPIAGLSVSTAAGIAEVEWPRSLFVLVSDEGRDFYPVADLVALPTATGRAASGYATFQFSTHDLTTHGRYVAVLIDPSGPYTFCDEVEVFHGDAAWLQTALTGEPTRDLQRYFTDAHMRVSVQSRLAIDLAAARQAIDTARVSPSVRELAARALVNTDSEIAAMPMASADSFRAVLPLNAVHTRILSVHGLLREASGLPALAGWASRPWDFIQPTELPPDPGAAPGSVALAAMAGETRSGAVSLSNSTGQATTVRVRVSGVPDAVAADIALYEVAWTDTRELIPVADALTPLRDGAAFTLPAGMTRQVWVSYTPTTRPPGSSSGVIEATADNGGRVRIPIALTQLPGRFPDRLRLQVGGWDYTDSDRIYGLNTSNRDAIIGLLRRLKVNAPWATTNSMAPGSYDAVGRLATAPDTSTFDRWVAKWPGASRYLFFIDAGRSLGNVAVTDARFAAAAGEWINFWVAHAAGRGIPASQLSLLLVDEPRTPDQNDRIVAWASAIKASQPAVRIWENPTYPDPASANASLFDVSDVLALKRSLMLDQGARFTDVFRQRRARGQSLDIYGSDGPARLLDPYTYYRLQAWVAADVGADSSFFWSFIDDATGTSWNEYATTATPYSPLFLDRNGVTSSKHAEAIREGAEDFEYLAMLRDRVNELSARNPNHAVLPDARALLESAVRQVLDGPGANEMRWTTNKDRTSADRVRLAIAEMLGRLN